MLHARNPASLFAAAAVCALSCVGMGAQVAYAAAPASSNISPSVSADTVDIVGTVHAATPGKQPLAGITVTAVSARGQRYETITGVDGSFHFNSLRAGRWTLLFAGDNMLTQRRVATLETGHPVQVAVEMESKESADLLRVTGKRNLLHDQIPSNTTFIDKNTIDKYKTGNNLNDVIGTAPGVSLDSFGNVVVRGEHNTVGYVLDDVVLPEAVGQFQLGQVVSPHSLEAVQVTTGGYEASAGGTPMGAIVTMQSMPIVSKPVFQAGTQIGGPMQGGINYYSAGAVSQNEASKWNRVRVESSGQIFATKLGVSPPTRHFTRDGEFDINILNKVEWRPTERDRFRLTAAINENYAHLPTPYISRAYGYKQQEHDRQNFVIASWKHQYRRWIDESNLHVLTAFFSQRMGSTNVFNPAPIVNGEADEIVSASPTAKRFDFVLSMQGDIRKTVWRTHHLRAGFYTEFRPVKTYFSSYYYDANPTDANYGQLISPFTGAPGGPQLLGNAGKYSGFRFVQGLYLQDHFTPVSPRLKRLTLDYGVRFDIYHGVFGNTMGIAQAIAQQPGIDPFLLQPFKTNTVTNAQASGRYAMSYQVTPKLVARASYAQVFTPPPVDLMARPFDITGGTINGIWNGSLRPMQATRGKVIDASLQQQFGPRTSVRASLYYKYLHNVGDELPVNNTLLYQRLTLSALESYGVESRVDLKPKRDGSGFFGFASNTVMVAKLGGNHKDSGGIYDIDPAPATAKYIDHDRRETLTAALGYRTRSGFWVLADVQAWTGFLIGLDPALFGAHPARTKPIVLFGLNAGYNFPKAWRQDKVRPTGIDVRIQNIANNVVPINIGSPFQGTRYTMPLQVLAQVHWSI